MDVVYPLGASAINEELRYSLRSLVNLADVGQVFVIGYRPRWFTGETMLTDQGLNRFKNTSVNMLRAIDNRAVSDPFLWFNDDFFALRPVVHEDFDRGPIREYLELHRVTCDYRTSALGAYQFLQDQLEFEDPLDFEIHTPLTVHKKLMREVLSINGKAHAWKRSVYGNLALRKGLITTTTREDVKIGNRDLPVPDGADWVSTSNRSFQNWEVGRVIRNLFPEPSSYEKR